MQKGSSVSSFSRHWYYWLWNVSSKPCSISGFTNIITFLDLLFINVSGSYILILFQSVKLDMKRLKASALSVVLIHSSLNQEMVSVQSAKLEQPPWARLDNQCVVVRTFKWTVWTSWCVKISQLIWFCKIGIAKHFGCMFFTNCRCKTNHTGFTTLCCCVQIATVILEQIKISCDKPSYSAQSFAVWSLKGASSLGLCEIETSSLMSSDYFRMWCGLSRNSRCLWSVHSWHL